MKPPRPNTPVSQPQKTVTFTQDAWNQFRFNVGQLEMKVATSEMLGMHVGALASSQIQPAPEPPPE